VKAGLPRRLLFEVTVTCPRLDGAWDLPLEQWPSANRLPPLGLLDGEQAFADVYLSWNAAGLFIAVRVPKAGPPVINRQRPEGGDSLQVWLDTRPDIAGSRATEYCHRFVVLPGGAGPRRDRPSLLAARIPRSRSRPARHLDGHAPVRIQVSEQHYCLIACLGSQMLGDFRPHAGAVLGFNYMVTDVPRGRQTWSSGPPLPFDRDRRLWARIALV